MSDYRPMEGYDSLPTPHVPLPERRDPRYGWAIALLPLLHLAVQGVSILMLGGASTPALILTVVVQVAVSVALATRDERALWGLGYPTAAGRWLALLPALYLLVRGARRTLYARGAYWPFGIHLALAGTMFFGAQWLGGFQLLLEMQTRDYLE